jgi:hypothetical protein
MQPFSSPSQYTISMNNPVLLVVNVGLTRLRIYDKELEALPAHPRVNRESIYLSVRLMALMYQILKEEGEVEK